MATLALLLALSAPAPFLGGDQPGHFAGDYHIWTGIMRFDAGPETISFRKGGDWSYRHGILQFNYGGRRYMVEENCAGDWHGDMVLKFRGELFVNRVLIRLRRVKCTSP
jgi:hypothetical protein